MNPRQEGESRIYLTDINSSIGTFRMESRVTFKDEDGKQHVCDVQEIYTVQISNGYRYMLNYERTAAFAERMQEELKAYGAKIIPVHSSDEAIDDADLLIIVTPSSKPVFDGTKVKVGATISCVGAYQHHMQEMDPAILPRASKIYFDSKEAVLSESGDILIPLEEGIITE